jgi:uncharacterized OsmC-like protein
MYSASIENKGDSRHYARTGEYAFTIDTEGRGANPVETLLAGLCGCVGHWTRDYLRVEQMEAKGFGVKAEAEPTGDRKRLLSIDLRINVEGVKLDARHKEGLHRHVQDCLVYNTLKAGCAIAITVTD